VVKAWPHKSHDDFRELSSCYDQSHTIEKRGKTEIITVAKILLTNQMILIDNCDFSSILIIVYTQPNDDDFV